MGLGLNAIGSTADAAATGDGSLIGIIKRVRDLLTGTGALMPVVGNLMVNGAVCVVKFGKVFSAPGDTITNLTFDDSENPFVAGKKIVVLGIVVSILTTTANQKYRFLSNGANTLISGDFADSWAAESQHGLFETLVGEGLSIQVDGDDALGISALRYIEVDA